MRWNCIGLLWECIGVLWERICVLWECTCVLWECICVLWECICVQRSVGDELIPNGELAVRGAGSSALRLLLGPEWGGVPYNRPNGVVHSSMPRLAAVRR